MRLQFNLQVKYLHILLVTASQQICDKSSERKLSKICNNKKVLIASRGTAVFLKWKSTEKNTKVLILSTQIYGFAFIISDIRRISFDITSHTKTIENTCCLLLKKSIAHWDAVNCYHFIEFTLILFIFYNYIEKCVPKCFHTHSLCQKFIKVVKVCDVLYVA